MCLLKYGLCMESFVRAKYAKMGFEPSRVVDATVDIVYGATEMMTAHSEPSVESLRPAAMEMVAYTVIDTITATVTAVDTDITGPFMKTSPFGACFLAR